MPSNVIPRGDRFAARMTVSGAAVWLGTFDTPEQAQAAIARARGRAPGALRTVADLAAAWEALDPGRRSEETIRHRAQMVAGFVRAHGRTPLEGVGVQTAQAWATSRPGSVRYLRSMFGCAVRVEALDRNVWGLVRLPERVGGRLAFTEGEVAALALAATVEWPGDFGLAVRDMVLVAAYTGARLSECAGLRVCDVLGPDRLFIACAKRAGGVDKPRTVAVFGPAREALVNRLRTRGVHGNLRLVQPERGCAQDAQALRLLFLSENGRRLNRKSVARIFARLRTRAGVDGTFHSLRHFHGSWLLDQGASDLDVAAQLGHFDKMGHADATLVRRVYGHPSPSAALERLDAAVQTNKEGSDGDVHDGWPGAGVGRSRARGVGGAS